MLLFSTSCFLGEEGGEEEGGGEGYFSELGDLLLQQRRLDLISLPKIWSHLDLLKCSNGRVSDPTRKKMVTF